jgi:hypothetical protein
MDKRKHERELDENADASNAPGDVLGLGRIVPDEAARDRSDDQDANQPPLPEERDHVGSRDVTEGTTGGTGPDTGGTGVFRRGSGATGTDIGR